MSGPPVIARDFQIKVEGSPLDPTLVNTMLEIVVDDHLLLPDAFTIKFDNPITDPAAKGMGGPAFALKIGADVKIETQGMDDTGMGGSPKLLIHGEVTALSAEMDEFGQYLVVHGYDHSHRLHRGRKTKAYPKMKDSVVAQQIASDAGLSGGRIDATATEYEQLSRLNMTDWEFLKSRANEIGYEVLVTEKKLNFTKANGAALGAPPPDMVWGDNLMEFRPRVTSGGQVGTVKVQGWDPKQKQKIQGQQSTSSAKPGVELDSRVTPTQLIGKVGGSSSEYLSADWVVKDQAAAQKAAEAIADDLSSSFAEAEGVAQGDPAFKAGAKVTIKGVGADFEGKWTLTHTRHTFDPNHGYLTHFEASGRADRSLLGLTSLGGTTPVPGGERIYGPVVGIVTDLKPKAGQSDSQYTVKLKLPWLDDQYTTEWARVVSLGAGKDRGMFWMPEVNDEVLVFFEQGDVRRPYVVGGLWNGQDTGPEGADENGYFKNGNVFKRTIKARNGGQIQFVEDDGTDEKLVIQAHKDGKLIVTMDKTNKKIIVNSDGTIEITSDKAITIESKQDNITIKAQKDVSIEGMNVNVKASAGGKFEASATLDLKGAMVNLG
jgi:phage protein D/phage baseplate assembly protein gpV